MGAGAMYLSDRAIPGKTNLRLNWIEGRSYANEESVFSRRTMKEAVLRRTPSR